MKIGLSILLLSLAVIARADLGLEVSDDSHAVVYREAGRVYYEPCGKAAPTRGCSGRGLDALFSADADRYARSVQSFFGLVDRQYAGRQGGVNLDAKIRKLQGHLDRDPFTADELREAENVLLGFVRLRDKLETAEREILQYLEKGTDSILNEDYQRQRFHVVNLSFYPVTYSAERKKIYRFSENVNFPSLGGACAAFDKSWSRVGPASRHERGLRTWLASAPIVPAGEVLRVWTEGATEGVYKVSCNSSYQGLHQYYNFPDTVRTYAPANLRDTERSASLRNTTLCKYTANGVETGRQYISGETTVVDLGAVDPTAGDAREAVEAAEGVPSASLHPVLCEKDYDFKAGDSTDGYLNGEHFATFSIYDLETSLDRLAKSVYANRAEFFRNVSKALSQYPLKQNDDIRLGYQSASARLLVLLAIDPLLHDIQSKFVDRYVLPDYNRSKEQWAKRLGVASLSDIEVGAPTYRLALELLRSGLQASAPYLNGDDKKAVEALLPVLGKAMATGTTSLREVISALKSNEKLIDRLIESYRVHGFGVMVKAIGDYLEAKQPR